MVIECDEPPGDDARATIARSRLGAAGCARSTRLEADRCTSRSPMRSAMRRRVAARSRTTALALESEGSGTHRRGHPRGSRARARRDARCGGARARGRSSLRVRARRRRRGCSSRSRAQGRCPARSFSDVLARALAVQEVNAAMGVIVAAPTAGGAGVLPAVLTGLARDRKIADETGDRCAGDGGAHRRGGRRARVALRRGGRLPGGDRCRGGNGRGRRDGDARRHARAGRARRRAHHAGHARPRLRSARRPRRAAVRLPQRDRRRARARRHRDGARRHRVRDSRGRSDRRHGRDRTQHGCPLSRDGRRRTGRDADGAASREGTSRADPHARRATRSLRCRASPSQIRAIFCLARLIASRAETSARLAP